MLIVGLSHGAIVERKLFAVLDRPKSIHTDEIPAIGDSDNCPAIGVA